MVFNMYKIYPPDEGNVVGYVTTVLPFKVIE